MKWIGTLMVLFMTTVITNPRINGSATTVHIIVDSETNTMTTCVETETVTGGTITTCN